jgi:hypothetical protein
MYRIALPGVMLAIALLFVATQPTAANTTAMLPFGTPSPSAPAATGDVNALMQDQPVTVSYSGTAVDFAYTADQDGRVTITAHSVDGNVDTILEVYDAKQTLVKSNDDSLSPVAGLSGGDSALQDLFLAAGTYTIRLTSFSGTDSGDVVVTVQGSAGGATPEPQTVQPVSGKVLLTSEPLKVMLSGTMEFVYPAVDGETITINVAGLPDSAAKLNFSVTVFNPAGEQMTTASNASASSGAVEIKNLTLPAAGSYKIELRAEDAGEAGGVEIQLSSTK